MKKGNYTWSQRRRGQEEELEGNDGGMGSRDGEDTWPGGICQEKGLCGLRGAEAEQLKGDREMSWVLLPL